MFMQTITVWRAILLWLRYTALIFFVMYESYPAEPICLAVDRAPLPHVLQEAKTFWGLR